MTNRFFTNAEIQALINEPKQMDYSITFLLQQMKHKKGKFASFLQISHEFSRKDREGHWLIYIRQSIDNPLDFSCGLGFIPEDGNKVFPLRRYNGKSHPHTNHLDGGQPFYDFHIHEMTEKYQNSSYKSEHYATPTNRYTQLRGAVKCLLDDFNIKSTNNNVEQIDLFE